MGIKLSNTPSVFLDTMILRYGIRTSWKFNTTADSSHPPEVVYRLRAPRTINALIQWCLLPYVAKAAKNNKLTLVTHRETFLEELSLGGRKKGLPDSRQLFTASNVQWCQDPYPMQRVVVTSQSNIPQSSNHYDKNLSISKRLQADSLADASDDLFLLLQECLNTRIIKKGVPTIRVNSLLDAFHLLCAERSGCEYFLTNDTSMINDLEKNRHRYGIELKTKPLLINQLVKLLYPWLPVKYMHKIAAKK